MSFVVTPPPHYAPYGNAIYGITAYGSPPAVSVQTTMSVLPIPTSGTPSIGLYDSLYINWVLPGGNWNQMVLVRSSFAVPGSPFGNDGVQLLSQTSSFSTSFTDTGLQTGRFYYYALYVYDTDVSEWLMAASAQGLCLTDYGFENLFVAWTPDWYMEQDQLLIPPSPLRRFFGLLGFEMNWVRSEIETLFTLNSPEYISGAMLPYLGGNVGIGYEPALGMGLSRNLVSQAVSLYKTKGTATGVQAAAAAYSGYGCVLTNGSNLEIQLDDATADRSTGHWQAQNQKTTITQVSSAGASTTPVHANYLPIQGNAGLSNTLLTTVGAEGYLPPNNENMLLVSATAGQLYISECNATNATSLGIPIAPVTSISYMYGVVQPSGWWRLNETVPGPAINYGSVGTYADGGLTGTGTLIGQAGAVPIDTAYTFNGNGFISTPFDENFSFNANTSFFYGAFFKTTSSPYQQTIVGNLLNPGNSGNQGFNLGIINGYIWAQVGTSVSNISYGGYSSGASQYNDGKWHFAFVQVLRNTPTTNAIELVIYVDGVLLATATLPSLPGNVAPTTSIKIAADPQGTALSKFSGSVQEVIVGPGALSSAQVKALYNSLLGQTVPFEGNNLYVLSGYFQPNPASVTLESFFAQLDWYSSNGSLISSSTGSPVIEIAGQWVRPYVVATPPSNAVYIGRTFKSVNANMTGDAHLFDAVQLETNTQATPGPTGWTPPRDLQLNLFPYARNLVINGQGVLGTTGFDSAQGNTITAVTTGPAPTSGPKWPAGVSGGFSVRTALDGTLWQFQIETTISGASAMPVNSGQAYSGSIWVLYPSILGYNLSNQLFLSIAWYANANANSYISTTANSPIGGVAIGQANGNWIQVSNLDAVAPTGAQYAQLQLVGQTAAGASVTAYVAAPSFGPGLNTVYFDGLFSPSPDYSFEGAAIISPTSWYPNALTRLDRLIEVMPQYTPIGSTFSIYTHANAWANVGLH